MKAGKVVPEVGEEKVRELIEGNYRIIYEIKGVSTVEVLCIIHGMRLLKNHRKFKGE
jgi:plasmid stabilization system protein ParE